MSECCGTACRSDAFGIRKVWGFGEETDRQILALAN